MNQSTHELGEVKANVMRAKGRRKRLGGLADHMNRCDVHTREEEDGRLSLTLSQERQSDSFRDEENEDGAVDRRNRGRERPTRWNVDAGAR